MARCALLVITDGRDCLRQTLRSAEEFLPIDGPTIIVSDFRHKKGLSGAVREGWHRLRDLDCEYAFHLEDDFVFREMVPVYEMCRVLDATKAWQVALKRDAVNPVEQAAGGFMEANPDNYEDWAVLDGNLRQRVVISKFGYTLNPHVFRPADFVEPWDWPEGGGEAEHTDPLRRHFPFRPFLIFGSKADPPRCFHIGHQRAEGWKL